jgi:hypothetical protein
MDTVRDVARQDVINDDFPSLFMECREDVEEEREGGNPWLLKTTTTPYRNGKKVTHRVFHQA